MRIWHLVTLAGLGLGRDSAAQAVAVAAQAIPVVTRADHTAAGSSLTEAYLTQPIIMTHAAWGAARAVGTFNFEGLTLQRGELNTGGYGEGYVDRRHPHAYVHELLAGVDDARFGFHASLFAGRGFAPFGSDDPMVRPFEKYPVNHHLSQILERTVAVGAVQRGPLIAEVGTFNGDEPLGPGTSPNYRRFGDSWSTRITLLPLVGVELSGSVARVRSPEERTGAGLDQHKVNLYARYARQTVTSAGYALVEWARTNEIERGGAAETVNSLRSVLAEGAYCRAGVIVALRAEHTDRPEEEPLSNPFRSPRPSVDLSNLGVSKWTTFALSISSPALRAAFLSARPFVEVERVGAGAGNPPGIFNPDYRYGARRMWMVSGGVRLVAGMPHMRMGRYGAALPGANSGTVTAPGESHGMPGMPDKPATAHDMSSGSGHPAGSQCSL
jgi:hypothetical protein